MLKQGFTAHSLRSQSKVASDSELFFPYFLNFLTQSVFLEHLDQLSPKPYKKTYCLTYRKPWKDKSECRFLWQQKSFRSAILELSENLFPDRFSECYLLSNRGSFPYLTGSLQSPTNP